MNLKPANDFAIMGRKSSWITGVHRSQSELSQLSQQNSTMGKQNLFHTLYNKYSRRSVNSQVFLFIFFFSFVFLSDLEMLSS